MAVSVQLRLDNGHDQVVLAVDGYACARLMRIHARFTQSALFALSMVYQYKYWW